MSNTLMKILGKCTGDGVLQKSWYAYYDGWDDPTTSEAKD